MLPTQRKWRGDTNGLTNGSPWRPDGGEDKTSPKTGMVRLAAVLTVKVRNRT
jgi:hypothetical protein